jgi:hypothetical protein
MRTKSDLLPGILCLFASFFLLPNGILTSKEPRKGRENEEREMSLTGDDTLPGT